MNLNKIGLVSGLVVSGIAVSSVFASANADTFDISYFNNVGTLVGSGQFTDVGDMPTTFLKNPLPFTLSQTITVTHALNSFSSIVLNTNFNSIDPATWYADPSIAQIPGQIFANRLTVNQFSNQWFVVDSLASSSPNLFLYFLTASATSASGTFLLFNPKTFPSQGTFTATLVPEPSGTATLVPEPSANLGLIGLALFGTVSTALKRRKVTNK